MTQRIRIFSLTLMVMVISLGAASAWGIDKLPADRAGHISPADGQIAFLRDSSLWITNVIGTGQRLIQDAGNAVDVPSWSPDNRQIIFSRKGWITLDLPDNMGGGHTVYDLFIAYLDSAEIGNTFWYFRPTLDLGSRSVQWTTDNKLIFEKDLNANTLNILEPNYQLIRMNPDGSEIEVLRKDYQWASPGKHLKTPSLNKNGLWAFTVKNENKPAGMAVLHESKLNMPMDSIIMLANKNFNAAGPSWSPDGNWLAYVISNFDDNSVRIATPDLKEHFLVFEPPVSANVYGSPSWSPDSKWLTFATTDGSIWICDITGTRVQRVTGPGQDSFPAWSK